MPDDLLRLCLYVAGMTPAARTAKRNLEQICEAHLPGRYSLSIVDLHDEPHRARDAQIIAVPTLVREAPGPVRKIIGDLSRTDRVLSALGIDPEPEVRRREEAW